MANRTVEAAEIAKLAERMFDWDFQTQMFRTWGDAAEVLKEQYRARARATLSERSESE